MAEIRVERKRRSSVLPWILGLLVLALAIWAVSELMDNDRDDAVTEADEVSALTPAVPAPLPVAVFAINFAARKASCAVPDIRVA
ncbi:MAG TPA: hypothetical protein VE685_22740 [Thermoanaerobaculia bacterium]|nr:hypothetical protein [Thermoanaerobaculia bacterium]